MVTGLCPRWLYVEDHCSVFDTRSWETYCGVHSRHINLDIMQIIKNGERQSRIEFVKEEGHDAARNRLDKNKTELGWTPRYSDDASKIIGGSQNR